MKRPTLRSGALLAAAGLTLVLGGAPLLASASDHLDAPALGGLSQGGMFDPHSDHGDRDIADLYVFDGSASKTVFALTTNPAVNLFGGTFGANDRYILNVDRNGDAIQDLAYVWRFGAVANGAQTYTVTRYEGANAVSLGSGTRIASGSTAGTGISSGKGGVSTFAGVRSDPFFFDLTGFEGTVFGLGTDQLGSDPTDFFLGLNVEAIVLQVPNDSLGGSHIGVWGATSYWNGSSWVAADQVGRPAINTVFNNSLVDPNAGTDKNRFNTTPPSQQRSAFGGQFKANIVNTLENINAALGTGCSDDDATQANGIANLLLPDVLTYTVGSHAAGPLNGRALADDVIDTELGLTTNGCVVSDGVGPHTDYLSQFPYLGLPH
ncbi:MAG TPA: DUF4331 family protein [Candidatus Limnocylindrales bacterium]|nr:DUF4331 family protein [Candidatus Limnocylindrales bacterium]